MKILIEAGERELEALGRAGVLQGALVLQRTQLKRRRLSKENESTLIRRLEELRRYKQEFGTFEVPRSGSDAELGDWLDKLRESYVKAPDGYRIKFLEEHGRDLLGYLEEWANQRVRRLVPRPAAFWMSAAWAAEFMEKNLRAPSQGAVCPEEVAIAKWLTRWNNDANVKKLKPMEQGIAVDLDEMASQLRRRNRRCVINGKLSALSWRSGGVYEGILLVSNVGALVDAQALKRQRANFWPTWLEWKSEEWAWKGE